MVRVGSVRSGFSLMEIMIVIAIMGVLGGVFVPMVMNYLAKAKVDTAKQSLRGLKTTLDMFNVQVGDYPDSLKDLYKKPINEELAKNWSGPYVEDKRLVDPWKNKFQYAKTPGQQHPFELYSYGAKGKGGSKDERIDVWSL